MRPLKLSAMTTGCPPSGQKIDEGVAAGRKSPLGNAPSRTSLAVLETSLIKSLTFCSAAKSGKSLPSFVENAIPRLRVWLALDCTPQKLPKGALKRSGFP